MVLIALGSVIRLKRWMKTENYILDYNRVLITT